MTARTGIRSDHTDIGAAARSRATTAPRVLDHCGGHNRLTETPAPAGINRQEPPMVDRGTTDSASMTGADGSPSPAPDLSHLHPDRLRLGGTGVFAGDWARINDPRRGARIPVGFIGVLIDTWNGWAVFTCTRQVADAIVDDQQRCRDHVREHLAAGGRTGEDLTDALEDTMPSMRWDGDDIVLNHRHTACHKEVVDRFRPDTDGNYIVCGWNWTWEAVPPQACDRIAGIIPPEGEHQRWVQLTHTDMRVPHERLRVTTLRQHTTANGVAYTATLSLNGTEVGIIENHGNGGQTWLRPARTNLGRSPIDEFTHGCRLRGEPVSEEDVLVALVNEYDTDRIIRAATSAGATVVRLRDAGGHVLDLQLVSGRVDLATIRAALASAPPQYSHAGGVEWQIWSARRWRHLDRVHSSR